MPSTPIRTVTLFSVLFSLVSANVKFNLIGKGCCRQDNLKNPPSATFSKHTKVGSVAKCQQLCAQTSTCTAIEFTKMNGGICEVHTTTITETKNCRKAKCYTASFPAAIVQTAPPVEAPVVTLGTLSAPASSTTTQKVCTLQPGFDFSGGDLAFKAQPNVKDLSGCAAACVTRAECKKFTYAWKKCFLKDDSAGQKVLNNAISATCNMVAVSATAPASTAPGTTAAAAVTTAIITAAPATSAIIVPTTAGTPATTSPVITAAPVTTAASTAAPVTSVAVAPTGSAASAAPVETEEEGSCVFMKDVDFKNNDLARDSNAMTNKDCARACLINPACNVFTFLKPGACFLKYRAGKVKSRSGAVSGMCTGSIAVAPALQSAPERPPAPAPAHGGTGGPPPPPPVGNYTGQKKDVKLSLDFTYKKFSKLPRSLMEAQGGAVNGKLYVFGGFVNGYRAMAKDTWEWDPAATQWTQKTSIPSKWSGASHMANAVDEKTGSIYLLGGIVNFGNGKFPQGSVGTAEVYKYNAKADKWATLPSLPEARGGGAAVVLNNKLHFFNGAKFEGGKGGFLEDMSTHWQLDLANTNAGWKKLAPNSLGRNHVGGAVWGGKIYAIGGQFFEEEGCTNQKLSEVYDPKTNKWSRIADLPHGTGHISPSTLSTPHGILVVGGVTDKNAGCKPPGFKRQQILFYNPTTNTWTDHMNYHTGASMVSGLIDGKVWAQHGSGIKEIGIEFTSTNKVARSFGSSLPVQSEAWSVAGFTPTSSAADAKQAAFGGNKTAVLAVGAVAAMCMVAMVVGIVLFVRTDTGADPAAAEDPLIDDLVEVVVDTDTLTVTTVDMFEDDDLASLAAAAKTGAATALLY